MLRAMQLPGNVCPTLAVVPPTWLPLVSLPLLAMLSMPAPVCRSSGCISSSNLPPYILSPPRPVPVGANSIDNKGTRFLLCSSPHWWLISHISKQSVVAHWHRYAAGCICASYMRCCRSSWRIIPRTVHASNRSDLVWHAPVGSPPWMTKSLMMR